jgi:hypothetical protein
VGKALPLRRIVRLVSVAGADTGFMERPRVEAAELPLPPEELLQEVRQLRGLLDQLVGLSAPGEAWRLQPLRRNVDLALERPETLLTADNQLDFIEELTEALWQEPMDELGAGSRSGATWEENARREELRRSVWDRLDARAELLCERVERWHVARVAPPGERTGEHRSSPA